MRERLKTSLIYLIGHKRGDIVDLNIVKEILTPFLEENDCEFYDVELVKEFGYLILRVMIDKKGGIDVDTLALANEYLSERIDKYDADLPEYMLEVSSPGAEKKLRNLDEIKENIGKYVHVEINDIIYEGNLLDCDDEKITLRVNLKGRFKNFKIKHNDIKMIRLAVKL